MGSGEPRNPASGEDPPLLTDEPRQIGPYKLLDVLGEGGMGVVYLAEQFVPVRRRVALKILKPGMDTRQVVARFESERQALAVMDHPNIAKVLDGGVTPAGRPFFVMELVQGTTITDYADTHRLTTRERLRLFIDLCRAVQHAHHKGVIHRDLKPSNVLVAVGDTGPTAKVIDFGIAKAVGLGLTERTLVTHVGQMVGTPEYMSPEQAEMSGLDVDTRTDIYSLGVMLYELIVGAMPFDLAAGPEYLVPRTLRERDVPRPSTRLTGLGDAMTTVARHRRTTPALLRRELRGDLDWIILKAMEKDRTRRYDTANGLGLDLQRYLDHEPVLARSPSARYRLGKFVRRNRAAAVAALVALMAVLVGAAAASVGMVQARRAQLRAERAAATAGQVSDFLIGLFQVSDPGEARGNTITAREVLDRGAERIHADLADQPVVQARLMRVIAEVYRRLGLYQPSRELFETAVTVAESAPDPTEAEMAAALQGLGIVLRQLGDREGAESALRRAIDAAGQADGAELGMTRMMSSLAGVYMEQGRFTEAEPLLRDALAIQERLVGPDDPIVANTVGNLAAMYLYADQPAAAEPHLRRVLALDERLLGPDHPQVGETWSNLGVAYFQEEKYELAESAYRRAREILEPALGQDHPNMAGIYNNLGETYAKQGRYAEAEPLLMRALDIKTRTMGAGHASLATTLKALANLHRDQARYAEAEPLYREALAIRERTTSGEDDFTRQTLEDYARLLRLVDRAAEADVLEARAAAIRTRLAND